MQNFSAKNFSANKSTCILHYYFNQGPMNTVAKGNRFEDRAYDIIAAALNEDKLGFIPGQCRIFRKAKYYGHDRKSYVDFDLSIEVLAK